MKTAKEQFISSKIKRVMEDGVRGKKVPQKQAAAIAYSYAKKKPELGNKYTATNTAS